MNKIIVFSILLLLPTTSMADTIYMKTGKTIETSLAWEDGDKVCFYLNGLKVSVPRSDVRYIENSKENSSVEEGENSSNENQQIERVGPGDSKNPVKTYDRFDDKLILEKALENKQDESAGPDQEGSIEGKPGHALGLAKDGGFRDLKWGDRLSNIKGMVMVDTDTGLADVNEYLRIGDNLKIGGVDLQYIVYAFWRQKLYTITLWTKGAPSYTALRDLAFETYGKGLQVDPQRERYIWYGGSTDMMLEFLEKGEYGMFWMRSRDVHSQFKLSGYRPAVSYTHWLRDRKENREDNKAETYKTPPE